MALSDILQKLKRFNASNIGSFPRSYLLTDNYVKKVVPGTLISGSGTVRARNVFTDVMLEVQACYLPSGRDLEHEITLQFFATPSHKPTPFKIEDKNGETKYFEVTAAKYKTNPFRAMYGGTDIAVLNRFDYEAIVRAFEYMGDFIFDTRPKRSSTKIADAISLLNDHQVGSYGEIIRKDGFPVRMEEATPIRPAYNNLVFGD